MQRRWPIALLLVFALTCPALWALSKEQRATEAEQAALEDEAAEKKRGEDGGPETVLVGKFFRQVQQEVQNPEVFGAYLSGGHAYLLKVENPTAKSYLLKNERKVVKLAGRIRNEGKYFIVEKVIAPVPLAPPIRNRRGI